MGKNKSKKGAVDAKAAVSTSLAFPPQFCFFFSSLSRSNADNSCLELRIGQGGQEAEAGEQAGQDGHESDQEEEGCGVRLLSFFFRHKLRVFGEHQGEFLTPFRAGRR